MNAAQEGKYWRLWGQIRKARPDLDRHELHIQALGEDKSHKDFTNDDFDKFVALYHSIINPDSLDAQLHQLGQHKNRLLWKITIEQFGLLSVYVPAVPYVLAILQDQMPRRVACSELLPGSVRAEALRELDVRALENLRSTLAARINALRKAAGHTIHEMTTLAGLKCDCAKCAKRGSESRLQPANAPF